MHFVAVADADGEPAGLVGGGVAGHVPGQYHPARSDVAGRAGREPGGPRSCGHNGLAYAVVPAPGVHGDAAGVRFDRRDLGSFVDGGPEVAGAAGRGQDGELRADHSGQAVENGDLAGQQGLVLGVAGGHCGGVQRVLGAVTQALAGAPGCVLLDVGSGTGNYAMALRAQGWAPLLIDASPQMRQVAQGKGLPAVPGEAERLPFGDATFDAVTMISMLHQVADWGQALAEARRVLRPKGCLAVMLLTADHIQEVSWAYDLFPAMRELALPHRPSLAQLHRELPGSTVIPVWFDDLSDASIATLCAFPEAMLDPGLRRQTSFFGRLERDHPSQLQAGLTPLRSWLGSGRRPEQERAEARGRLGDASVIAWQATPGTQ